MDKWVLIASFLYLIQFGWAHFRKHRYIEVFFWGNQVLKVKKDRLCYFRINLPGFCAIYIWFSSSLLICSWLLVVNSIENEDCAVWRHLSIPVQVSIYVNVENWPDLSSLNENLDNFLMIAYINDCCLSVCSVKSKKSSNLTIFNYSLSTSSLVYPQSFKWNPWVDI